MNEPPATTWLGVCLPRLPLEVFTRGSQASPDAGPALAITDAREVLMADAAAESAGILPGTQRSAALALRADLRLLSRDPAREQDALEQAACWALQFTPSVSLQSAPECGSPGGHAPMPSGLVLEVAPSLRLFGGREALVSRLRAGLSELGFSASIASAPNPSAAWLLALHADGARADGEAQLRVRLAPLPLALLEAARPHLETLAAIGVRQLNELARLPRAGLARRFGKALLEAVDLAYGLRPEPRAWFGAPPTFHAKLELMASVENAEALLFGAQRLVTQLAGWLGARHAATTAFELQGEHDTPPATVFQARFAEPVRDPARMLGVLRETLPARALRAPVHTLVLRCEEIAPLPEASADLFPVPAADGESLGRLVERLQARLGREQVQRLLLARDHRPEEAYRLEPFDTASGRRREPPTGTGVRGGHHYGHDGGHGSDPGSARGSDPGGTHAGVAQAGHAVGGLPRPLWLLARPVAIGERNNRPFWHGPLDLLAGPERIESGWWDGRLVRRDYFIAADASGAMLWLYRERQPDPDGRGGWFVHGRFA